MGNEAVVAFGCATGPAEIVGDHRNGIRAHWAPVPDEAEIGSDRAAAA